MPENSFPWGVSAGLFIFVIASLSVIFSILRMAHIEERTDKN